MDKLIINQIVPSTTTNDSGIILKSELKKYFELKLPVVVSFKNINAMSTSFFNSSFGELIEEFGVNSFKSVVKPADIQVSILEKMKKWISLHS